MKRYLILLNLVWLFAPALWAKDAIRISNGEWEPYLSQYVYEYGVASHIVSEAFKIEGVDVTWGFFPWSRAYELTKQGSWDASAVWWDTPDARAHFWVSEPVVKTSFVFFHLKSTPFNWKDTQDLTGLKIGFTRGFDYGVDFMQALGQKKLTVDITTSDEQNFKKLLTGRIDIFPNDPIVGQAQLHNNFTPAEQALFTHHPKVFAQKSLHLIISKQIHNGKQLLSKFNAGLRKLKKSGQLNVILQNQQKGLYNKQKTKWIPNGS